MEVVIQRKTAFPKINIHIMKKSLFAFCMMATLAIFSPTDTHAQKTLTDGVITYEMKAEGNPMMAAMGEVKMDMAFKGTKSRMTMNMMNGLIATDMVFDNTEENKGGLMLMSMMGKNMAIKMGKDEIDKFAEQQRKNQEPPKITEYKNAKKKIAGYKCYKVLAEIPGAQDPVTLYISDKIKPAATSQFQMQFPGLKGYPLGIEVKQMGMTISFNAVKIATDVPEDSFFEMAVPEGYEEKTMEDLMQMNGGAGGGLFGM